MLITRNVAQTKNNIVYFFLKAKVRQYFSVDVTANKKAQNHYYI